MKPENVRLLIEFPNEVVASSDNGKCVEPDSSLKCGWTTLPGEKSGLVWNKSTLVRATEMNQKLLTPKPYYNGFGFDSWRAPCTLAQKVTKVNRLEGWVDKTTEKIAHLVLLLFSKEWEKRKAEAVVTWAVWMDRKELLVVFVRSPLGLEKIPVSNRTKPK